MSGQYLQTICNKNEALRAYVLMNVTRGSESQVAESAKALGSLKKSYCCFSMYDLVLEIESKSINDLKELVHKYRTIKGVQSILVLLKTNLEIEENFKKDKERIVIFPKKLDLLEEQS